jgi:acyl carrier protein
MEFVFAAEDRFDVRIPEDRLDPRQAGVTLERLADLLDEAIAAKARPDVVSS